MSEEKVDVEGELEVRGTIWPVVVIGAKARSAAMIVQA